MRYFHHYHMDSHQDGSLYLYEQRFVLHSPKGQTWNLLFCSYPNCPCQLSFVSLCSCSLKMKEQRICIWSTRSFPYWKCCSMKSTSLLFFSHFRDALFSLRQLMFAALLTKVVITVTISYLIAIRKRWRRSRPRDLDQVRAPPSGEQ